MRSFSDLTFYTIPESPEKKWTPAAHLRTELDLFAGQLYFDNVQEYRRLCMLLALHIVHQAQSTSRLMATFKKLTALRRKGMGFGGTDLGRVLDARPLSSEFASWVKKE
ncbi:hypothetical protein H4582DRAFT_1130953 [Lactarius indigo]|nr:hypothetical protein H4582DRAFT_1130953 [Lactarius indigo]